MTPTTMMTEAEQIANTEIVFAFGPSGAGKSFTGDYLAFMHNFYHVDGDTPVRNCSLPKYEKIAYNFFKVCHEYILKGEDGPEELWKPFYEALVILTLDEAKHSDKKIVLSHAVYRQTYREYVVTKLIEGGVTKENITVLQLTIDPEVKLRGLYHRAKKTMESSGMTVGDYARANLGWEGAGDITCTEFINIFKETFTDSIFEDIPNGFGKTVDVSGRDMITLDRVDEALCLVGKRNDTTLTFEEIRDKVKTFDEKRRDESVANGSQAMFDKMNTEFGKKGADDNSDDDEIDDNNTNDVIVSTEEQDMMEKRRSSLAYVDQLSREFRRSSFESNNSEVNKKIMKERRASLIRTGKI